MTGLVVTRAAKVKHRNESLRRGHFLKRVTFVKRKKVDASDE